jgi:hypothetical protein
MLDYAANAVAYWPVAMTRNLLERRCAVNEQDPVVALSEALGNDIDYESFWERVKTNMLAKRIRLLFVADSVPLELRRIVEFLNEVTDPLEVLALEVRQFVGQDQRVLVPRIYGQTQDAAQRKRPAPGPATTLQQFLSEWDETAHEHFARLLEMADAEGLQTYWGAKGFSLRVPVGNRSISLIECYPPSVLRGQHYVPLTTIEGRVMGGPQITGPLRAVLRGLGATFTASGGYARFSGTALTAKDRDELLAALRNAAREITANGLVHGPA